VINATEAKTLELQRFQAVNSIESIFGGSEGLSIVGSKGNDVLDFSMTTLEHVTGIDAGDGNDTVIGSAGDDVIIGGRGNDNLSGGDGDDQFVYREGDGADRYTGGSGKDVINATEAKTLELQRFQAVNSIESIFGGSEGLSIVGSKGNDVLDFSMTTLEHVTGIDAGDGNDTVIGSAGDDVIIGGRGNDNLSGGDGDDLLVLSGNRADYKIVEQSNGSLSISDIRDSDGNDRISGFERYQFADQTVEHDELFNSAPTSIKIDGDTISESAEAGTIVGKLWASDEDRSDKHEYTLVDKNGKEVKDSNFEIRDNAIVVRDGHQLNYETSATQELYVQVTDSAGASFIKSVEINIGDSNDTPTDLHFSGDKVSENAEAGTVVGKLWASDEDRSDKHEYTLVDKNGKEVKDPNFEIRDNVIVVRDGHQLNYETSATQELYVQVTDSAGASFIKSVEINIGDSNDTPTDLHFSGDKVSENAEAGTVVGKLWASDEDRSDKHEYTLVDKNGKEVKDPNFEIRDNVIVVRDGHQLNYETSATQELYVQVTDSAGASFIKSVEINIGDSNDTPTDLHFSGDKVSESAEAGTIVGKLWASDEDRSDKHEYTLVDKNGKEVKDPNFEIRDNVIVVRDGHQLNYETSATQELYVQVTDSAGASFIKSVEINIGDSNDTPTDLHFSGDKVSENAEAGTVVGKLWASDEDRSDKHEYTLVDKNGKEVKDPNFEIRDNVIVVS
jgi:Ca2+-binding RTX toxin-like protein